MEESPSPETRKSRNTELVKIKNSQATIYSQDSIIAIDELPKVSQFDSRDLAGKRGSLFTGTEDPILAFDAMDQPKKSTVQAREVIMLLKKPSEQRTRRNLEKMDSYFEEIPFFKQLSTQTDKESVMKGLKVMFLKEIAKNETVFKHNDTGDLFYVILKGQVDVICPIKQEMNINEKELFIFLVQNRKDICWQEIPFKEIIQEALTNEIIKLNLHDLSHERCVKALKDRYKNYPDFFQVPTAISKLMVEPGLAEVPMYKSVAQLGEGKAFGETALTRDEPRNATIKCLQNCVFSCMDKENYQRICKSAINRAENNNIKFFNQFRILQNVGKKKLRKITQACKEPLTFQRKNVIYQEGQEIDGVYFIKKGEFEVTKKCKQERNEDKSKIVNRFDNVNENLKKSMFINNINQLNQDISLKQVSVVILGEYEVFGLEELLYKEPLRIYTVTCNKNDSQAFFCERQVFSDFLAAIRVLGNQIEQEKMLKGEFFNQRIQETEVRIVKAQKDQQRRKNDLLENEMQEIMRQDIKKEIQQKDFQKVTKKIIKDKLDDRVDLNYLDNELRRLNRLKRDKIEKAQQRDQELREQKEKRRLNYNSDNSAASQSRSRSKSPILPQIQELQMEEQLISPSAAYPQAVKYYRNPQTLKPKKIEDPKLSQIDIMEQESAISKLSKGEISRNSSTQRIQNNQHQFKSSPKNFQPTAEPQQIKMFKLTKHMRSLTNRNQKEETSQKAYQTEQPVAQTQRQYLNIQDKDRNSSKKVFQPFIDNKPENETKAGEEISDNDIAETPGRLEAVRPGVKQVDVKRRNITGPISYRSRQAPPSELNPQQQKQPRSFVFQKATGAQMESYRTTASNLPGNIHLLSRQQSPQEFPLLDPSKSQAQLFSSHTLDKQSKKMHSRQGSRVSLNRQLPKEQSLWKGKSGNQNTKRTIAYSLNQKEDFSKDIHQGTVLTQEGLQTSSQQQQYFNMPQGCKQVLLHQAVNPCATCVFCRKQISRQLINRPTSKLEAEKKMNKEKIIMFRETLKRRKMGAAGFAMKKKTQQQMGAVM